MKISIVDDNKLEQHSLTKFIQKWAQENHVSVSITTFDNGEEFTHYINNEQYDIVFMDIIMDKQNGIEAAKILRCFSLDTMLIFITSSTEFMAQAFPCHAFDYLIKPYSYEKLSQVLNDAKQVLHTFENVIDIASEKILLSDILYVYSDSNYCDIYTTESKIEVRISFTELSKKLSSYPYFMVVSRGVLVNFNNTSHISGFDCVMKNGDRVPVSRRKIKETEQAFMKRQFSNLLAEGK